MWWFENCCFLDHCFNVGKAPVHAILQGLTDPVRKADPVAIVLAWLSGSLLAAFMVLINVVKTEVKLPKELRLPLHVLDHGVRDLPRVES